MFLYHFPLLGKDEEGLVNKSSTSSTCRDGIIFRGKNKTKKMSTPGGAILAGSLTRLA